MTVINVCRSCARASLRGTRKLLTAKEKRRNVAKKNNVGHAIDVRTSAVICREPVASPADFAMRVLSEQGRESEAGPKFCVAVERARDRARAAAQHVELFRDSVERVLWLGSLTADCDLTLRIGQHAAAKSEWRADQRTDGAARRKSVSARSPVPTAASRS